MQITELIYFYSVVYEKLLNGIDGGRGLDVGCGSGQFTGVLAGSLNSFTSITGVDVDEAFLASARKEFPGENFTFIAADSRHLPFEDGSFDLVAISKALHHVEDPLATLEEMKRVLSSGGYFLLSEMHRDGLTESQESHMLYHHLRSEIDRLLGISHNHTFHREDLIRMGTALDLSEKVILEYSPEQSYAMDPENIAQFCRKMDGWLGRLTEGPEKAVLAERVEDLKNRFRECGFSRAPQLIILGRK